jgi:hypothetical protein
MCVWLLACAVLALGGCGGDDGDSSSSGGSGGKPLTKAAYLIRAGQICSDTEAEQAKFKSRIATIDQDNLPAGAAIIADALKITRQGFDRLKALSPPASDRAIVDHYVAAVERLLGSRDKLVDAARKNNRSAGLKASREGDKLDVVADRLGARAGLDACDDTI